MSDTMRAISRKDFTSAQGNTLEAMNAGSLQRIADATEKMALRHTELIRDRDMYERWYSDEVTRRKSLERQLSAAKGQITKLKRKLAGPTP